MMWLLMVGVVGVQGAAQEGRRAPAPPGAPGGAGAPGGRVFLRPEVQEEEGQQGIVCTSLPALEPQTENLYFACTCPTQATTATFSLARFAHQLDPSIFSRQLVVDFRDCWTLHLTMDHLQLSAMDSDHFRPDIHFLEINVENMYQVHLVQDPGHLLDAQYVNPPARGLTVRLYEVNQVTVDTEAELDRLVTEWRETRLQVDLTTADTAKADHTFDISGFPAGQVSFLTADREVALAQGGQEFRGVLADLRQAVLARARHMSLGLALCVAVLTLGLGAMMLATVRRHQLTIEAIIYSGLDTLRRGGKSASSGEEGAVTTTTKVDFFPRYSIVNKSRRGRDKVLEAGDKEKEASKSKPKEAVEKKGKEPDVDKSGQEKVKPKQPHVPATYSIFTTLKFPAGKRPALKTPTIAEIKAETKTPLDTSFYYKDNSSSNYDLTMGKKEREVVAEVHSSPGRVEEEGSGGSPVPLLPPRADQREGFYSFRTLQERCRKMIQGAKPWPANPANTKL